MINQKKAKRLRKIARQAVDQANKRSEARGELKGDDLAGALAVAAYRQHPTRGNVINNPTSFRGVYRAFKKTLNATQ